VKNNSVRVSGQTTGPKVPARPQKKTRGKPPAKPRPASGQAPASSSRLDTPPGLAPLLAGLLALIEAHRASAAEGPAAVVLLVLGKIADLAQRFATAPGPWRFSDFASRWIPGEGGFVGLALAGPDAPKPPPAAKPPTDDGKPVEPRASRAPDVVAPAPLGALHRLLATLAIDAMTLLSLGEDSLAEVQSQLAWASKADTSVQETLRLALLELLEARSQTRELGQVLCQVGELLAGDGSRNLACHVQTLTEFLATTRDQEGMARMTRSVRQVAAFSFSDEAAAHAEGMGRHAC